MPLMLLLIAMTEASITRCRIALFPLLKMKRSFFRKSWGIAKTSTSVMLSDFRR